MARARQQQIPGTERKTNKKIAGAARVYVDARDTRMEHTKKEKEAKNALITLSEGKADVKVHEVSEAEVEAEEDADE